MDEQSFQKMRDFSEALCKENQHVQGVKASYVFGEQQAVLSHWSINVHRKENGEKLDRLLWANCRECRIGLSSINGFLEEYQSELY